MGGRAEALDGGVAVDHGLGHAVAGGVGIEAAVNGEFAGKKRGQPGGIGSGSGGGDTDRGC